ncbi:hypothetical protein CAPTEDRAFT_227098 [Capitella teleta]|uniref:Armadillo repeat-containing domain-containing protein n=1 Tax=Capitella teleta TaxID=283909 RepID=R7TY70_CAPTE|nr:hypothetical protein CAPTEDRAFT_227098 [Capitella teleta]|eukprot:ELT98694.1 hypothetical protein CAPTEDRAFT_227098 [Capitella teleta]
MKEKRMAAFELATMAASGDDNKFRIVAEGGLEMLIRLALSKDESTQEHSVEAIAELLTVPAIQDNFIEIGGVRSLTALLHSPSARVVYQCATAISYIVSDAEENRSSIVADHGLEDLAHAAKMPNSVCQRLVAGIFLELAFTPEIRNQMASLNTPARALTDLCASPDQECQRLALQTLELLAIESPETICAQDELLKQLLKIPELTYDTRTFILVAKILLYYAEDQQTCEDLLDQPNCKSTLTKFARTKDPILQKVVVKVIYCMLQIRELRYRAEHVKMDELLRYVRENASDRETWDMADQSLQFLACEPDGLQHLPPLSTLEKIDRMESVTRGSLSSCVSLQSGLADSIVDLKKGLE